MRNRDVAQVFEDIADLLEIKGEVIYRVISYRRAAEGIRSLGRDIHDVWKEAGLREIPGVGEAIEAKIDELLRTGKLEFFQRLRKDIPPGLIDVLHVGDVGPKRAARFWKELGITTVPALEKAARAGRLREMSGMGAKSEARILENIERMRRREQGRLSIGVARPIAEELVERLRAVPTVMAAEAAGSVRRWRETVGDLDLLAASDEPSEVLRVFASFPEVERVLGKGETKASVELRNGLRAQLWVHPPARFGTALQYATGSQAHNVRLRERAQERGLSLSEHGFKDSIGQETLCPDEVKVYSTLGLPWIPPELREDRGEIAAAAAGRLPRLLEESQIRGEFHAHTTWSDGQTSLQAMAEAARDAGLEYLVVTDHSKALGMIEGMTPEKLKQQRKELDQVQRRLGDSIRLLHGAEVEILADGTLDFDDRTLASLDLVVASIHTSLRQPRSKITSRLLSAIRNPHVDMIGHPTGRLVLGREAADLDVEPILEAAADHGVVLEINAHPERLDLNDVHARQAWATGCLLAINSDAHKPEDFALRRYGVGIARRAWLPPEAVLNTRTVDQLLTWLASRG
ncbi:MAG TPA: DNA polymerase/3'-5' exonuclease PolX [Anaerolineales bacterium]|nr:DNA polymerase/3'-5' exonuclease PolX [Anaerolineales bacterium]